MKYQSHQKSRKIVAFKRKKTCNVTAHIMSLSCTLPKGDLWVQSPMIIVGQSPAIYRSVSSGYAHLAEHDGWHCRRRFAKVVLSSFARLK